MPDKKIVILAGPGDSTNIVYHALEKDFQIARVIIEKPVDKKTFLKRRVKSLGLGTVFGQLLFKALVEPVLSRKAAARLQTIMQEAGLSNAPIDENKVLRVESVNSNETITALKELNPDAIVVNGTRIIAKKVLLAVNAPFINTHAGITPLYRGVHGGYWALANKDPEHCGVTVHLVDPGIDTGNILYQALIQPTAEDNFITYPLLQLKAGLPLLKKAINDAFTNNLKETAPPAGTSKLWSHPTISEYFLK